MTESFFTKPILSSPYEQPRKHWKLVDGQPTSEIVEKRRPADFITPIPKPKKKRQGQLELVHDEGKGLSNEEQRFELARKINELRGHVEAWRNLPNPNDWGVTPETARLLQHWRHHPFSDVRPFFCQVEAIETAIWLTEVAHVGKTGRKFLDFLAAANEEANPGLPRLALKLATGAGKTMVMAMLIAWQTINAVRRPGSKLYSRGFLVVAPGLTIRDRLRVLLPNDPDSYYKKRELVPGDLLPALERARIVITNYHAFKLRETLEVSPGGRRLIQGRGPELKTLETEGQMIQRVMPELMGLKSLVVLNDEGHHCYRRKPGDDAEGPLKGDDKQEAKKNEEAARLWISGLEAVQRKLGLRRVFDLSATPFFLRGSGYPEGTLFPWTMSDFSLMDAIECGIVKLPRVPVADNIPGDDFPKYRKLWDNVRAKMPKKGRGKATSLDPLKIPPLLLTALEALYGHYAKTFESWKEAGIEVPPCFIIVCNNTSTSKLIYDFVSGFHREAPDGTPLEGGYQAGRLELFRNHDEHGRQLGRPRTLLIDSEQLESGEALNRDFRKMASEEIEQFRRDIRERTGDPRAADNVSDQDLLREVMNTVGQEGRLGEQIRCVVSVSMLTEGWDARNVTHILGVRAFGTQLLCEQVVGRALRRQSYELNAEGLFEVEYADILGVPFDFAAEPVVSPPQPPPKRTTVKALREREALEIRFPRVAGYRVELPDAEIAARFNDDSTLVITPETVGPTKTRNQGIIGEAVDLDLEHLGDVRRNTVVYKLALHLLNEHWREPGEEPRLSLFGQLRRITEQWLDEHLVLKGGTHLGLLLYEDLAERACTRISRGIVAEMSKDRAIKAMLDAYNPEGSTRHVFFSTTKETLYQTDARRCHVNWVVCDSDWEAEFCRVAEAHPRVLAYVKNDRLGLEVPYRSGSGTRRYLPDFVVLVDDGHGASDPLHLVVEIKGFRGEDAKDKKATMEVYWVPGVNNLEAFGRWAFAEFRDVWEIEADFGAEIEERFARMLERTVDGQPGEGM